MPDNFNLTPDEQRYLQCFSINGNDVWASLAIQDSLIEKGLLQGSIASTKCSLTAAGREWQRQHPLKIRHSTVRVVRIDRTVVAENELALHIDGAYISADTSKHLPDEPGIYEISTDIQLETTDGTVYRPLTSVHSSIVTV